MGRKLDGLLGRNLKTSKLKTAIKLATTRLSLLKNNRHARFNIARSDIVQLLRLNHHQQALLRVEQVIKDQDMLDVYDMVHDYCHLLILRIKLIEQANDCPEVLKEAVSSLLYAAPRCREFPELQEIRAILTNCFGKEFVYNAIDLKSNHGVNQKMLQKLSPKQSSLECRMKMLTGIAKENGILLQLRNSSPEIIIKEKLIIEKKPSQLSTKPTLSPNKIEKDLILSESMNDAFESAATRSESFDSCDGDSDEETMFPSRNAYFSSYKKFPFRHQVNPKGGLGQ